MINTNNYLILSKYDGDFMLVSLGLLFIILLINSRKKEELTHGKHTTNN